MKHENNTTQAPPADTTPAQPTNTSKKLRIKTSAPKPISGPDLPCALLLF
jgi:hypothetical protein